MGTILKPSPSEAGSFIVCDTIQGLKLRAILLRFTFNMAVFEVHSPFSPLRTSEVLKDFQIILENRVVYEGKAVVSGLINVGAAMVCEVALDASWVIEESSALSLDPRTLQKNYHEFFRQWEWGSKIRPEFKLSVADIQIFLADLRLWLDQMEFRALARRSGDRSDSERAMVHELVPPVSRQLNSLFEKFEFVSAGIDKDFYALHSLHSKRQLHSLLLSSPFMHRIYEKPLGYAGDYEMVSMILRDPLEGSSLFSKILNSWFLGQVPAEAHRNRVKFLTRRMFEEAARLSAKGGRLRVLNLGCGPAREVQDFIAAASEVSNQAEFTLLDFNEETLSHTRSIIEQTKRLHHRNTLIRAVKKSVAQVLKTAGRPIMDKYELIYCAGLFDYLPERTCKQLMNIFYAMLAPGGVIIATNVDAGNPIKRIMGFIFEWHLVYRTGPEVASLAPAGAAPDDCVVTEDITGCN